MRIGIFGGTFNPIHSSHMRIASEAVRILRLDRLLFVPASVPPHKKVSISAEERLKLVSVAAKELACAEVSDLELNRSGPSYTADTVLALREQYPEAALYLILGSNKLSSLAGWYRSDILFRETVITVVPRALSGETPGAGITSLADSLSVLERERGARTVLLPLPLPGISSSDVRNRLFSGLPISGLVPRGVELSLYETGLYFPENIRVMQEKCRLALNKNDKRYLHTMAVVRRAAELAALHGVDPEKARLAALLHDCAKYLEKDELVALSGEDPVYLPVLHSFAGAVLAEKEYGVTDPEILDAIRYHSTGFPEMTPLGMLIYLADLTEDTRRFPSVDLLRAEADKSLPGGMLTALSHSLAYLNASGQPVHPATVSAYEYYQKIKQEEKK